MSSPLRKGPFSDKAFISALLTLAFPIMFQNFLNSLVNMADTVMIGRLGTVEIAGVGLGNQVFFFMNIVLFGVVSGGGVFTAQFWGKKDLPGIRKTLGLVLTISLLVTGTFAAACAAAPRLILSLFSADPAVIEAGSAYLKTLSLSFVPFGVSFSFMLIMRTVEKVHLATVSTMISLSLNVALNWAFIFGLGPIPAMGVLGAARATVLARIAEALILVTAAYARRYPLAGTLRELLGFDLRYARDFFVIALPVMVNEFLWSLGVVLQSAIFARASTESLAAFNITNTVAGLVWVIFIGLGNGVSVLIGKRIGEGNEAEARSYAGRIAAFSPMLAAAAALFLAPASFLVPLLFRVGGEVVSIASAMFVILAFMYPFRAFNMTMVVGVCRAGGDTRFGAVYDLLFMWVVALPLAASAAFLFGAPAPVIYLCVVSEEPLKALLGLWRLKSGRWLRRVA